MVNTRIDSIPKMIDRTCDVRWVERNVVVVVVAGWVALATGLAVIRSVSVDIVVWVLLLMTFLLLFLFLGFFQAFRLF